MIFDSHDHKAFYDDIRENGFHIFSRRNAELPGYYPNRFPAFPELAISDIRENDAITIRAFFPRSKAKMPQIDSGYIDLEVESVDYDSKVIFANILTRLPPAFTLSQGTTIELKPDEVLVVRRR